MNPWSYQDSVLKTLLANVVAEMAVPITIREPNRALIEKPQPDPSLPPAITIDWDTDGYKETDVPTVGDENGRDATVEGDLVCLVGVQGGRGAEWVRAFMDALVSQVEAWMLRAKTLDSGSIFWFAGVTPGPFYYEGDISKGGWYRREVKLLFRRIGILTGEEVGILANLGVLITPPVPGPGIAPLDCVGPLAGVWQKVRAANGDPVCLGIARTGTDGEGNITVAQIGLLHFPAHGLPLGTRYVSQDTAGATTSLPSSGQAKPILEVLDADNFIVLNEPGREVSL